MNGLTLFDTSFPGTFYPLFPLFSFIRGLGEFSEFRMRTGDSYGSSEVPWEDTKVNEVVICNL